MGSVLSVVRNEIEDIEDDKTHEMEKSLRMLDFMEIMLKSKMESFANLLKHQPDDMQVLPPGIIVDQVTEHTYNAKKSNPSKAVEKVIDRFLSNDIISGFKEVITYSVNAIINNQTLGESFRRECHLLIENNALVRIDILFYKYDFGSDGITTQLHDLFCYMFHKSVIPAEKLDHNLLVYAISKYINNTNKDIPKRNEAIKKYIK
ncbi:16258_t:CDS:2, partial [Racocetra persica]